MLYIAELTYPGTWLGEQTDKHSWQMASLLSHLEHTLAELAVSLTLFHEASSRLTQRHSTFNSADAWEERMARMRQIEQELEADGDYEPFDPDLRMQVEIQYKREKWIDKMPDTYEHLLPFLYARSFLYALDEMDRFLAALAAEANLPAVTAVHTAFRAAFPQLRDVRNSTAHVDERAQGLGPGKKQIALQPLDNGVIKSPNGAMIMGCLFDNRFAATMVDGHCGEVEVSATSLGIAKMCLQDAINAFKWRGPPKHVPS